MAIVIRAADWSYLGVRFEVVAQVPDGGGRVEN